MARRYAVGDRVDGLYDGNSDDVWYPGVITAAHDDAGSAYDVLYDDGETEQHVAPHFLRVHAHGTLCVGSRVYGRYAGGDEWYAGAIHDVQDDGTFTIAYDDGEVEASVVLAFICETLVVADDGGEEGGEDEEKEEAEEEEPTAIQAANAGAEAERVVEEAGAEEQQEEQAEEEAKAVVEAPSLIQEAPHDKQTVIAPRRMEEEPLRFTARHHHADAHVEHPPVPLNTTNATAFSIASAVVDDSAAICSTIDSLETTQGDALATKTLLSTLVKQMRAYPQATADVVHTRNGEALLIAVLKRHGTHAVIQCYAFVLLRRLCFLCGKSTHVLLRHGMVELVAVAMRKFPEDAILQAAACGVLAVFTRVHAGLTALLANRVSHLVLATIIFHKAYSVHTRQVHYYACEVLLELCELGDAATVEALCGGESQGGPGLSDLSPVSLLLFLLRQAIAQDDKKACCAVGTLLLCLSACHPHAAQMVVDVHGLSELSTVMATFPTEPGIQKYAASASKAIALCSRDTTASSSSLSPQRCVPQTSDSSSRMEDLHHQRHGPPRRSHSKIVDGSKRSSSVKRKAPTAQRSGAGNGFPSPATSSSHHQHQQQQVSFSKYTSPLGKAPHLPSNFRAFGETHSGAASPSTAYSHRNQMGSPFVILDSHGAMTSDKKPRFAHDERTQVLFETYGVDARKALLPPSHESQTRAHQGIKRRELKTYIVSASAVAPSGSDQISWASPVKSIILPAETQLQSSRSGDTKVSSSETRTVRSSGGGHASVSIDRHGGEYLPASLRRQQPQPQAIAKEKKRDLDGKTPRSASFQLKLDKARSSHGTASPIVLSPKTGRNGVSSSHAKATPAKSRPAARTMRTARGGDTGFGSNVSSESLNSYAAQLFKDELGTTSSAVSATRVAQERERLSFADKLHKMIDKAKSSLAHSSTVSLASEAHHGSPVKTTAQGPIASAMKKKQVTSHASVATSRVTPASIKSTGDTATASVSNSDVTVPKRPPAAATVAKPISSRKPMAAVSTASTSKPIAPPKTGKAIGTVVSRPTPSPATKSTASTKPTSALARPSPTVKPTSGGKKTSKAPDVGSGVSVMAATAAAVVVAAVVAAEAMTETSDDSQTGDSDGTVVVTPPAETLSSISSDEKQVGDAEAQFDAPLDAGDHAEPPPKAEEVGNSVTTPTPPSAGASADNEIPEPVNESPITAVDEISAPNENEPSTPEADSTPAPTGPATVVDEAAAVVASAADELYADEYNDFDDLDNAPQTLDDDEDEDGGAAGAEMGRKVSFEALMSLTAQVTEFTAATEATVEETERAPVELADDTVDAKETAPSPGDAVVEEVEQVPTALPVEETVPSDLQSTTEEASVEAEKTTTRMVEAQEEEPLETVRLTETPQELEAVVMAVSEPQADCSKESEVVLEGQDETLKEEESSPSANDEGVRVADDQDESAPISLEKTDRPESRETEASYADEDFDDATEDAGVEAADTQAALDDEPAQNVEPSATTAFAPAEPSPVERADDSQTSEETDTTTDATTLESDVSDRHVEGRNEETTTVIPHDNEDDYGDADFAGDESMPADDEQAAEAQGIAIAGGLDSAGAPSSAVTKGMEATAESADGPVDAETEFAVSAGTSEETEEISGRVTERDVQLSPEEAVVVANGVAAEEPVSIEATETLTTPTADESVQAEVYMEQPEETLATNIPVTPAKAEEETLQPEPCDEQAETSVSYGDANFDADAADPEREIEELPTETNTAVEHEPTVDDETQNSDSGNPAADPSVTPEKTLADEPLAVEDSEVVTRDAERESSRADAADPELAFYGEGADSEIVVIPEVTATETADDALLSAVGGEVVASLAEETSDCEVLFTTEEPTSTASAINADAVAEDPMVANDGTQDVSAEKEMTRDSNVVEQAVAPVKAQSEETSVTSGHVPDQEEEKGTLSPTEEQSRPSTAMAYDDDDFDGVTDEPVPASSPIEGGVPAENPPSVADALERGERASGEISPDSEVVDDSVETENGENAIVCGDAVDAETDDVEARADTANVDAVVLEPSFEDGSAIVDAASLEAALPDGDNAPMALSENGEGLPVPEGEESRSLVDEQSRPATAMAYADDDFDGETPPDVEIERHADEQLVNDDPVAATEPDSSLQELDTARPTTADAYATDAEFEDDVATEDFQSPPEATASRANSEEAIDSVPSVPLVEDADGTLEQEQTVEPLSEAQAEDPPPQPSDVHDADAAAELAPSSETDLTSTTEVTHEDTQAADLLDDALASEGPVESTSGVQEQEIEAEQPHTETVDESPELLSESQDEVDVLIERAVCVPADAGPVEPVADAQEANNDDLPPTNIDAPSADDNAAAAPAAPKEIPALRVETDPLPAAVFKDETDATVGHEEDADLSEPVVAALDESDPAEPAARREESSEAVAATTEEEAGAVDTSSPDETLPSEDAAVSDPEAVARDPVSDDNTEPVDVYTFDEEDIPPPPSTDQPSVSVETPETEAVAEAEEAEPLDKDDEQNVVNEEPPETQADPPSAVDDIEQEDLGTTEPSRPTIMTKEKDETEEETAYADDDDAYNEFEEDDDETPTPPLVVKAPLPADDNVHEDAYDTDEQFDDDGDDNTRILPPTTVAESSSSGATTTEVPQPQPTAATEEDGDYDAEYDDFED